MMISVAAPPTGCSEKVEQGEAGQSPQPRLPRHLQPAQLPVVGGHNYSVHHQDR